MRGPSALGEGLDGGSRGLPLVLVLTMLEPSGTCLKRENLAESSSQLLLKPVVPRLSQSVNSPARGQLTAEASDGGGDSVSRCFFLSSDTHRFRHMPAQPPLPLPAPSPVSHPSAYPRRGVGGAQLWPCAPATYLASVGSRPPAFLLFPDSLFRGVRGLSPAILTGLLRAR